MQAITEFSGLRFPYIFLKHFYVKYSYKEQYHDSVNYSKNHLSNDRQ